MIDAQCHQSRKLGLPAVTRSPVSHPRAARLPLANDPRHDRQLEHWIVWTSRVATVYNNALWLAEFRCVNPSIPPSPRVPVTAYDRSVDGNHQDGQVSCVLRRRYCSILVYVSAIESLSGSDTSATYQYRLRRSQESIGRSIRRCRRGSCRRCVRTVGATYQSRQGVTLGRPREGPGGRA